MTDAPDTPDTIQEPRCWSDGRWTAQVIKNEDDDGWAVSMTLKGEAEPALVGPWTMGRDKKNPKPARCVGLPHPGQYRERSCAPP